MSEYQFYLAKKMLREVADKLSDAYFYSVNPLPPEAEWDQGYDPAKAHNLISEALELIEMENGIETCINRVDKFSVTISKLEDQIDRLGRMRFDSTINITEK